MAIFLILLYDFFFLFLSIFFLQHITAEGTALVQQAEDAASNQVNFVIFLRW